MNSGSTPRQHLFDRPHRPYYIYAPPYTRTSAGIKALHLLCHALNLSGEEAYVTTDSTDPRLRTPQLHDRAMQKHQLLGLEPLVVYPEVVHGNPLEGRSVVRYVLNRFGMLGGPASYHPSDLLLAYSEDLIPAGLDSLPLFLPTVDVNLFNNENNEHDNCRSGTLFYPGRYGDAINQHQELARTSTIITYSWPTSHEELAALLRRSSVLYCFTYSAIALEATLCGCPVVFMPSPFNKEIFSVKEMGTGGFTFENTPEGIAKARETIGEPQESYKRKEQTFWHDLEKFIAVTQSMPIQDKPRFPPRFGNGPYNGANSWLELGIAEFQAGEMEAAIEALSASIEEAPDEPLAYAYLAFICAAQGLADDAGSFIAQTRSLAPQRHDLLAALGESFLKAGDPVAAQHYLEEAIAAQPDMFMAYPAFAEALRQNDLAQQAIQILSAAAGIESGSREAILDDLVAMLVARGDLSTLSAVCLRARHYAHYHSLGIRLMTRTATSSKRVDEEVRHYLDKHLPGHHLASLKRLSRSHRSPLTIAFVVNNFRREQQSGRLEALLQHLPAEQFITVILDNDPATEHTETRHRCSLLSDHWRSISQQGDPVAAQELSALAPDILIDVDGIGARHRLGLLHLASAPLKGAWSDIPLSHSGIAQIIGQAMLTGEPGELPSTRTIALPDLGEVYCLPAIEAEARATHDTVALGCLTPAIQVCADSWRLYASLLGCLPDSTLTINLDELSTPAEEFIVDIFKAAGIDPTRLKFIHARTNEELCRAWNDLNLGLAPLYGAGDMALPTALWMERPFIALDSDQPWSRRPSALLRLVGLQHLIATSPDDYLPLIHRLSQEKIERQLRRGLEAAGLTEAAYFADEFGKAVSQAYLQRTR